MRGQGVKQAFSAPERGSVADTPVVKPEVYDSTFHTDKCQQLEYRVVTEVTPVGWGDVL